MIKVEGCEDLRNDDFGAVRVQGVSSEIPLSDTINGVLMMVC